MNSKTRHELLKLAEAVIEDRASADTVAQLEMLVLSGPECMQWYLEFMELHGHLYWDAAGQGAEFEHTALASAPDVRNVPVQNESRRRVKIRFFASLAASLLVIMSIGWILKGTVRLPSGPQPVADQPLQPSPDADLGEPIVEVHLPDRSLSSHHQPAAVPAESATGIEPAPVQLDVSDDRGVVAFINDQLAAGWSDHELTPSPPAVDTEWIRRVYLDLAGRIPTRFEVESYLNDHRPDRRDRLLETLLSSRDYAANFATIWTNLLVGRSSEREIDRDGLFAYLETQFGENHAWSETVGELISASGSAEESGPANFLLAHLNNEAVPATAITARIFLCEQMQCSQCHPHPDVKSWGQDRFWEFNAFFHDTKVNTEWLTDQKSGKREKHLRLVDQPQVVATPADQPQPAPTFYETLRGVMQVAYPRFGGDDVLPNEQVTLRQQLADRVASPENSQFAIAFINRNWQHFFGHGFTRRVDDMGPHSDPSHPKLLSTLGNAFAATGYDVRRLVKWICLSDAYQLSSVRTAGNALDDPDSGDAPRFSRMYVKTLSPEQLFNSLMIAAGVSSEDLLKQNATREHRDQWLQQFFIAAENEENGEMTTFDGSLPQTLMMMNGALVQRAVDVGQSAILREVVEDPRKSELDRIRELCLAALSRYPTDVELESIRKVLRQQIRQRTAQEISAKVAVREGMRDLYWAYLNSSEFSVNH